MYTVAFATDGETANVGSDTLHAASWNSVLGLIIVSSCGLHPV